MNLLTRQFPYVMTDSAVGPASFFPLVPLELSFQERSTAVMGLVDSGAAINVLPFSVGKQLGAVWEEQTTSVQLTGNLARHEAKALIVLGLVEGFAAVPLAFAWTKSDAVPVILGQVNFFMAFDVCLFRSRLLFEVRESDKAVSPLPIK